MAEENPLLSEVSSRSGLPVKTIAASDNPLLQEAQQRSGKVITPDSRRHYEFSGLDAAAGQINLTNTYTDPLESYTSYGVPRNAFIDWNETRAENQTTVEKWAHGLTKAGITALGAVTENTIGVAGGLLNLAFGENHSYYDNPVGRTIDEVNEWARESMPNYYTKKEEEMGVLEGMTTANFWADKFANGAGYTLGSLATAWTGVGEGALIAKMAGLGRMAKIGKAADKVMDVTQDAAKFGSKQFQAYNAAKAIKAPYSPNFAKGIDEGLTAMAKRANINTAAKQLSVGMHMSLAEASVEAREAKNKFIEEQTAKWKEANPGQEMSADIEDGIISSANAVGNMTFGVNLPLLTLTNIVSFGNMFLGGKPTAEALNNGIKKVGDKWVSSIPEKGMAKAFSKANRIFGAPIRNSISEGAQEAGQFITAATAEDYYSDKFADGVGDMTEAFVNGLSKSIGTKEGLESILIGALVGGGSGVISALGGADKKFAKAKDANTQKALDIMNSEAFGKVLENMEQSQRNIGLVDDINKATQAGEFKKAEIFRRKLISSVADQYRKAGALDYAMEQMDDLKQLSEEEFKKRWNYDANRTLKEQTGMEQSELIDDVKSKMERSVKRQEQVQAIVRAQNPSMGMFSKILDSFDSEELKKSKALESSIRNMYANTLLYRLEDVDNHDDLIKQSYKELQDLAPAISAIPEEDFEFMVKTGKIKVDEKGDVTVSDETNTTLNPKLLDKLNEIFRAKRALNPEDAEQFKNKLGELRSLVTARQAAVQSYQGLRNKPEDIALLVEAEVERRKRDDKYKNKQQAQAAVTNAQSVEELDKAFPKNADAEDIAAAMAKREELVAQEDSLMSTYEAMSKDEFDAIDAENLSPLEESAYNRVKAKRAEKEAEENAKKDIGISTPDEAELARQAAEQVLSDIEARTFGEVMVNPDGNTVTINGRTYSNLEDNPLDALLRNEQGTIVGVRMTDMATGNEVTWKSIDLADSANPEVTERENAIAEGLAHLTLLKAASIRPDQSTPISEAKEELTPRIQAIKEDAEARDKFEENEESTEDERELAKNNLTKTAGLTDDQLRAQIETLKSDLEEVNQLITIEEQIAREAGFTKKEFDQDPQTKELRAIKKRITQLLTNKIKSLRDRKQTARQDALDTTNTTAEVENALSPSEEDLIKAGLEEEIKKFEDELVPLNRAAKGYQDIIDGKYGEGQDITAATTALRDINKKIGVVKAKITKRKNLINKLDEERELEKLRQDRDAAERAGLAPEGQEPEGKDITPGEGTPAEGLDGILSEEQVKVLRQQREEAERLRKLEEQKKKAQEVTPQPINLTPAPITVTTSGQLDVRLAKGEKTRMEGKVLVSEEGASIPSNNRSQTVGQVPIIVNPALASSPFIATEGTEVRFEVREDTDWWATQTPTAGEEWMTVPIFMYVKDQAGEEQAVGVLQSFAPGNNPGEQGAMRKDIYDLYKKGLTPVAMSAGKVYDSTNYSNAIVFAEDKQTGLQKRFSFFYPASTLVNTGETPAVVFVGIQDFQKRWKLATAGDTNFPNLTDTILSFKVSPALETGGNQAESVLGQVGVVVMDPNGAPRVVMASTRNMTEAGRTAALAMIEAEQPSLNQFAQIVGTNLLLNDSVDPAAGDQVYTEINGEMEREYSEAAESFMAVETLANGTELVTFYSPSAKSLVRMNAANMKVALAGGTPMFSFVEVGQNDKGHTALVTVKKDDAVRKGVESNLANEFKAAIMKKKFQVDKNMLNSKEAYTSPISGQVYDSYFQYLTSENEVPEERTEGKGTKAILGVDTEVNSQKSPFFDVGIKTTNLGTREQDVTTERELAAKQVVMPTDNSPTSYPITETPSAPATDAKADIEKRKKELGLENVVLIAEPSQSQPYYRVIIKGVKTIKGESFDMSAHFDKAWNVFPRQPDGNFSPTNPKTGRSLIISEEKSKEIVEKYLPKNLIDLFEETDRQNTFEKQKAFEKGPISEYVSLYRKENLEQMVAVQENLLEFYKSDNFPNKEDQDKVVKSQEKKIQDLKQELAALGQPAPSTQPTTSVTTIGPETKINIYAGTGENAELSNFANRPFKIDEYSFNTVEGYFQARKMDFSTEPFDQNLFAKFQSASGAQAKSMGRSVKGLKVDEWDSKASEIMKEGLLESFKQNPDALAKLLATGNATLTHTQDKGKWGKEFPKLLMEVREELRSTKPAPTGIKTIAERRQEEIDSLLGNYSGEEYIAKEKEINAKYANLKQSESQVPATTQAAPTVSDEEKVVEITGAEDTSDIFDLLGIPTETPKATEAAPKSLGLTFISAADAKEMGFNDADPTASIQDLATEAARLKAQAEEKKKNCKGK